MSQVTTPGDKFLCNNIPGLVNIQRQLCRENPDVMVATGKGARLGVEECQRQMKDQRWNCSTVARDFSVFGKIMKKGRLYFLKAYSSSTEVSFTVVNENGCFTESNT